VLEQPLRTAKTEKPAHGGEFAADAGFLVMKAGHVGGITTQKAVIYSSGELPAVPGDIAQEVSTVAAIGHDRFLRTAGLDQGVKISLQNRKVLLPRLSWFI